MKVAVKAAALMVAALAAAGCASNALVASSARNDATPGFSSPDKMAVDVTTGFSSPESVAVDSSGKRYFVSNMGAKLEPGAKDGDGFISELREDGSIAQMRFLPKDGALNSPKGLAVVGSTLYVTDVDALIGFDVDTREKVFELDFSAEGTAFLNDIAPLSDDSLAVSATDVGKVYRVALKGTPSYSVIADRIAGPNGLAYDPAGMNLYVVCFGEGFKGNGTIGVIKLSDDKPKYEPYTNSIGPLDGLAYLGDGKLLFSDWVSFEKPGRVAIYDIYRRSITDLLIPRNVRGPADFHYDSKNGRLWLPGMQEGVVAIEKIK